MSASKIIPLSAREAKLKRLVRRHLHDLGFTKDADGRLLPPSLDKESYRRFHEGQRKEKIVASKNWIAREGLDLLKHFAVGEEIIPASIAPELEVVSKSTWQSELFRMAALLWRVPVSDGYGRRMRFLVWDRSNDKLIGIIALGDAVFNQKARDEHVGWDHHRRGEALVNLMDAYVLGAVPPYNMLLGGKLIASMLRSHELVREFNKKYQKSVGVISGQEKCAKLVAITTSSALGRSSVYNRVALNGRKILEPIGFTSGWGHFHFSEAVFDELRAYLESIDDSYASGFEFGSGPNWKIRVIRRALERLGMDTSLAKHGFTREVFFCPVAKNATAYLRGDHRRAIYGALPSIEEIGAAAKTRWVVPRSEWDHRYLDWKVHDFVKALESPELSRNFLRQKRNALGG